MKEKQALIVRRISSIAELVYAALMLVALIINVVRWGTYAMSWLMVVLCLVSVDLLLLFSLSFLIGKKQAGVFYEVPNHPYKTLIDRVYRVFSCINIIVYILLLLGAFVMVSFIQLAAPNAIIAYVGFGIPAVAVIQYRLIGFILRLFLYSQYLRVEQVELIREIKNK